MLSSGLLSFALGASVNVSLKKMAVHVLGVAYQAIVNNQALLNRNAGRVPIRIMRPCRMCSTTVPIATDATNILPAG